MADAASDSSPASMPANNSRSAIASSSSTSAMALPLPLLRLNNALQQPTHRRPSGVYRFIAKQRLILSAHPPPVGRVQRHPPSASPAPLTQTARHRSAS